MRIRWYGLACGAVLALGIAFGAAPQAQNSSTPPASSSSYDPHDLRGVWFDDHPRPNTVMERYWAYEFTKDEPPMTEWGLAQYKAARPSFGPHAFPLAQTNDPMYHTCVPLGFPHIYLYPLPMQIVQTPAEVIMLFEWDSLRHHIYIDGRGHDTALGPSWMGDAIGHWDGDTLVVDTVNMNDKTWLDRIGHPHTEQLHVIERIRRVDHDHLVNHITFEDPKAYTKPWSADLPYVLKPKWTLAEQFCEDEQSFQTIDDDEAAPAK